MLSHCMALDTTSYVSSVEGEGIGHLKAEGKKADQYRNDSSMAVYSPISGDIPI